MEVGNLVAPNTKRSLLKSFSSNGWASTTLIINQLPNIADGWNAINEAKYKVEKHRVIIQIIRSNVDKMSDGVNIVEVLITALASAADSEAGSMIRIRSQAVKLQGLLITTKTKIDDLKIKVHKTKKSLMHLRHNLRTNMVGSAIHFTTNLLQYCASDEGASSTLKIVQGLLAGLVIANGMIYWIAGKELANPRHINVDILVLGNRVEELTTAITEAEQWIELNDPT